MASYITQTLSRAKQINRNGIALICDERKTTWEQVYDRVTRLAAGLQSLGVSRGDRVAVMSANSDYFFETLYAIWWVGAVATPINMRLAPAEVDYRIEDSGCEVLFVDTLHLDMIDQLSEAARNQISHVVLLGAKQSFDGICSDQLISENTAIEDAGAGGDDLAYLIYTGGSTGRSKGVMLSHDNIVSNGINALHTIRYLRDSVFLHAGPMSHLADGMSIFAVTMACATHVFQPRFTVEGCLELIERHRVSHVCLIPTMVEMIVQGAEAVDRDLSSLVQIQFGGAPMPVGTLKRAVALWPDILFLHGYGMTETAPVITMLPVDLLRPEVAGDKMNSCGQAMPNIEIKIVDPEGKEVPRGDVGELILRGPNVMLGYWNMPEATAKALRDGWMHTEDAAYMDEDGLVYVVDRLKDMIISGGENIYSTEVENALTTMPGIVQAAVIGVPHDVWGEAVHAVLVVEAGSNLVGEAVIAHCKTLIASYKCPKTVQFWTGDLPTTNAGKVDKKVLRQKCGY